MKHLLTILFFLISAAAFAQTEKVLERMKEFHQKIVSDPSGANTANYIHDSLTYGHSNGWVESEKEFREHLANKLIVYHSFEEDSIRAVQQGQTVTVRFKAAIDATWKGQRYLFHLKVLEVWVKEDKNWILLARQAVKG